VSRGLRHRGWVSLGYTVGVVVLASAQQFHVCKVTSRRYSADMRWRMAGLTLQE
jgi:hypothetical protein